MVGVVTYDLEPPAVTHHCIQWSFFGQERRKTNMAGVVTYDLEPPAATRHFLIGSGNRQQVTVFSGPFLVRKEKNKYGGSCHL